MNAMQRSTRANRPITVTIIIGAVTAILLSMLLATIVSVIIVSGILTESQLPVIVNVIIFLSVFISTIFSGRKIERHLVITTTAIAAIYMFVLIAMNIVIFDGDFSNFGAGIAVMVSASILSIFLLARKRKHKTHAFRRYR